MIKMRITGLKEVQIMLNELPENLRKEVGQKGVLKVTESLKRRAQYRYDIAGYGKGITSTGFGRRSMRVRPTGKGAIFEILAPYLALIERGVSSHLVSPDIITQHMKSPGSTIGLTAEEMGLAPPYFGAPIYWHYKGPFVAPALASLRKDIPNIIKPYIQKALQKAKRRR